VRLALQADVAQSYFNLRELDAELDVYNRAVALRGQALDLVQRRFDEGEISELDVRRAQSELATARSEAMTAERCERRPNTVWRFCWGNRRGFSVQPDPLVSVDIHIPPGSHHPCSRGDLTLLPPSARWRRPTLDRVAKAAFFPALT